MSFPIQIAKIENIKVIQMGDSIINIENESKKDKKVKTKTSKKESKRRKRKVRRLTPSQANIDFTKKIRSKQKIGKNDGVDYGPEAFGPEEK